MADHDHKCDKIPQEVLIERNKGEGWKITMFRIHLPDIVREIDSCPYCEMKLVIE